jgi:glycosyltransferase involved in cell wall biosynthesis
LAANAHAPILGGAFYTPMIHYMTTNGIGNAWVGNELRVVAKEGIPFMLHSLVRPPSTFFSSEDVLSKGDATRVLYPLPLSRGLKSLALAPLRFRKRFAGALWNAVTGKRETLRNRLVGLYHLYVACEWAGNLKNEDVDLIHSQWIHSGGTVAMYGAWLLDKPFSFTGHAADLFRERCALEDKIRRASFIVCISSFHRDFYLKHGARPEQLHIAYCGIDTAHFSPRLRQRVSGQAVRILSSGRLVEKKGFDVLIEACKILHDRGVAFECAIAGSGPLESALRAQVERVGLSSKISLTGQPLKQEDIPAFMHGGDVYCLPCVWASDDDVDGLPQMLMEAMACGLPAVSTQLVGIPDLIENEKSGLLVQPRRSSELADALERLIRDPELAARLAATGRERVVEVFDLSRCLTPLMDQFRAHLEAS